MSQKESAISYLPYAESCNPKATFKCGYCSEAGIKKFVFCQFCVEAKRHCDSCMDLGRCAVKTEDSPKDTPVPFSFSTKPELVEPTDKIPGEGFSLDRPEERPRGFVDLSKVELRKIPGMERQPVHDGMTGRRLCKVCLLDGNTRLMIATWRAEGLTYREIAEWLTETTGRPYNEMNVYRHQKHGKVQRRLLSNLDPYS